MKLAACLAGAAAAFTISPAHARQSRSPEISTGSELSAGILAHGISKPFRSAPPPGLIYEGEEERGTADIQLLYRSIPLTHALKPRLTAKLQLNTAGRTSFASMGAEWRQHVLGGRVYGQTGIGLTLHDGYRHLPDPFAPGISAPEAMRRYEIYMRRTGYGSRLLLNPNLSIGVHIDHRWAVEAALEHFSHAGLFSNQNPGIDNFGIRLVRSVGGR